MSVFMVVKTLLTTLLIILDFVSNSRYRSQRLSTFDKEVGKCHERTGYLSDMLSQGSNTFLLHVQIAHKFCNEYVLIPLTFYNVSLSKSLV